MKLCSSHCKPTIKLSENNAVVSYGLKTNTIFENEIPLVDSADSRNPFVNNQCIVDDFTNKRKSNKGKLRRKNKKLRDNKSCVHIVDKFGESESNTVELTAF